MTKKNELPALVASLLITVALVGGGAWWLRDRLFTDGGARTEQTDNGSRSSSSSSQASSGGESGQSVLPDDVSAAKQDGLDAYAAGDFAEAAEAFEAALAENKNDPESLIYLSNAEIGDSQAYTLAVVVPAGAAEDPAKELMRGAAQAQTDINEAGGINGTPIKILLVDDSDDADKALDLAADLVDNSDVLGVVGHFSSGTTLAAAEVYEEGGLPMISPTSTAVKIAESGEYIFRTVPSDRLAAATLSRYVLGEIKETEAVVFYTSESAYSQSVKSEFTTELLSSGGKVVADFDVSESGFDASEALEEATDKGATVIMLALNTATLDIANQIIAANQQTLPMVGGDSLYNPKILDVGRDNALGLTVAVPWHILSHEQTPFVQESRALWGGDVNWRTATAYDAVTALANGLADDPTRDGLAETLASAGLSIEGATDPIEFLPTGDRNQPSQLVEIVPGNRSGTGFDYVPIR